MIGRTLLILAIQTVVLAAMVGMKQWTLATGRLVLLETQPIDPRSLFRGDYVRLNYAISSLDLDELEGDDRFEAYEPIYVELRHGASYWEPRAAYRAYPQVGEDAVVIRGEVTRVVDASVDPRNLVLPGGADLFVRYGIENYFVPEGEGRDLERPNEHRVDIGVAVDVSGTAAISQVLVDGEVRYTESLL